MEKKTPNNPPKGWHLRALYVDNDSEVFVKGEHRPEFKDLIKSDEDLEGIKSAIDLTEIETVIVQLTKQYQKLTGVKDEVKVIDTIYAQLLEMQKKIEKLEAEKRSSPLPSAEPRKELDTQSLVRAIVEAQAYAKGEKAFTDLNSGDVPIEDMLDKPAMFSSYGVCNVVTGDKKRGVYIPTPYGRVFVFKYNATTRDKRGKETNINHFCTLQIWSKKEAEFLRKHTLYGIQIWESADRALSADAHRAQITSSILSNLQNVDQPIIIRRCQDAGIPMVNDISILRVELAKKMADKLIADEEAQAMARAKYSQEVKLMNG